MKNQFRIEILEDGTISVDTEGFDGGVVHVQADQFVKLLAELMGGTVTVKEKRTHAKQLSRATEQQAATCRVSCTEPHVHP